VTLLNHQFVRPSCKVGFWLTPVDIVFENLLYGSEATTGAQARTDNMGIH